MKIDVSRYGFCILHLYSGRLVTVRFVVYNMFSFCSIPLDVF